MIFFTSDCHFNDYEVIKREFRPFKTTKECDKYILKTWNKQAKKGDTIYVIGDFISYGSRHRDLYKKGILNIKKIKANVVLLLGNNEERLIKAEFDNCFENFKKYCLNLGFKDVKKDEFLEFNDKKFYLTHEPQNHKDNYINLFGHIHKLGGLFKPFGINIACDMNFLQLYSLDCIFELLSIKNGIEKNAPELLEYKVD
ncbi:MAG: hypothetical protein E7359_02060 [Clostridiales bacterium]|nr:hypothetical protein [Clostridiales bacterium]